MGYGAVEFAGYGNVPVPDLRATLDEYGMRTVGAHIPLSAWETQFQQTLEDVRTLGGDYAVVPWVPEAQRRTMADVQRLAEQFNQWGAQCQAHGLRFAYHNHAFEFAPLAQTTMFELLVTETDPALVNFELDVYWVQYAGHEPTEWTQRLAGRVPLLHVKDMAAGDERADTPVGEGLLPWNSILAAGAAAGTAWYIVEQDRPQNAMQDVEHSLHNLQQLLQAQAS